MTFDYAQELGRYRADLAEAVRLAALRKEGKTGTLDPAAEQRLRSFAGSFQAAARLGLVAAIPPHNGEARNRWRTAGTEIANSARGASLSPAVPYVAQMVSAYAQGDAGSFAATASSYRSWLLSNGLQPEVNRAAWEVVYNRLQPMFRAIPLYVLGLVLLFAAGSAAAAGGARVVRQRRPGYEAALLLLTLGFALHTTGLLFASRWRDGPRSSCSPAGQSRCAASWRSASRGAACGWRRRESGDWLRWWRHTPSFRAVPRGSSRTFSTCACSRPSPRPVPLFLPPFARPRSRRTALPAGCG